MTPGSVLVFKGLLKGEHLGWYTLVKYASKGATPKLVEQRGCLYSMARTVPCGRAEGRGGSPKNSKSPVVKAPATYLYSVSELGTGSGTVTGSGISCPGTCAVSAVSGNVVTLVAKPASGSTFAGWSGACSGTGSCSVVLTGDLAVKQPLRLPPTAVEDHHLAVARARALAAPQALRPAARRPAGTPPRPATLPRPVAPR